MSTLPQEAASTAGESLPNLLFDYPGADIILRSQDSYHSRVPRIYIINSSPVLRELIRSALESPRAADNEPSLPVVPLPESGEIIHSLLTIIFPVTPLVSSTPEKFMELLSVAQKYQMETALTNIRGTIARQNVVPTGLEPALHVYALAQKYGLRPEALQTARTILKYPMTIENLVNKVDIMPGASLYELWKYYERVRDILASDLTEFRASGARGTIKVSHCTQGSSSNIPNWLHNYIDSIGKTPNIFDPAEFSTATTRHIRDSGSRYQGFCGCASIPSQTLRDFWEALAAVIYGSFEKVNMVAVQSYKVT
jgi:hypothetical protein